MFPTSEEAVLAYERADGHLSLTEKFGTDLLSANQQLQKLRFLKTLMLLIPVMMSFSIGL